MLTARTRNTHLGARQDARPVPLSDFPVRATDGSLPAWALPLPVWQSGHGAMRGKLDVASPVSCFAVSAAQSFLAFTLRHGPRRCVQPWEQNGSGRTL
jgi:hypothetical protein